MKIITNKDNQKLFLPFEEELRKAQEENDKMPEEEKEEFRREHIVDDLDDELNFDEN